MQPIDRGIGQLVKFFVGQYFDEWLEDDDNLEKWESDTLSATATAASCSHSGVYRRRLCLVCRSTLLVAGPITGIATTALLVLPTGSIACLRQVLQGVQDRLRSWGAQVL